MVVKGKQRMAAHICATCWQKDQKRLEHPECSSSCPHTSAWLKNGLYSNSSYKHPQIVINEGKLDLFFPEFCQKDINKRKEEIQLNIEQEKFKHVNTHLYKHSKKCEICSVTSNQLSTESTKFLLDAHHQVIDSGKYNFEGCRIPINENLNIWTASSEFGTYRLCEQRRFRRACASAQSRQNLRCSLIQEVSQEEPSDRKPDP